MLPITQMEHPAHHPSLQDDCTLPSSRTQGQQTRDKSHHQDACGQRHDHERDVRPKEPQRLSTNDEPVIQVLEKETAAFASTSTSEEAREDERPGKRRSFYARHRIGFHFVIWVLFTAWWIAGLVLHRQNKNWIIPFLIWLCITVGLLSIHLPLVLIWRPVHWVWVQAIVRVVSYIPEQLRVPAGAVLTIAIIVVGAFASREGENNTRANRAVSLSGLAVFILVLWATSRNRKRVNWHTVITGILMQFLIALFVLRTKAGYDIFNFVSSIARELLAFAQNGVIFLTDDSIVDLHWFLLSVGPSIIFWVAMIKLLYHYGILPWIVGKSALLFFWSMRVSGAEAVVAVASPFVGMAESVLLIKPFVAHLTNAEIHQVVRRIRRNHRIVSTRNTEKS